jgi:F-type H+-transporting ATPase subunit delta
MDRNRAYSIARGVFRMAKAADECEAVSSSMKNIVKILRSDYGIARTLNHPLIEPREKESMLKALSGVELVRDVLRLLISERKLELLKDIEKCYNNVLNNEPDMIAVEINTPEELDDKKKKALKAAITRKFGKKTVMHFEIDTALIAGVRARIGSKVYDNSVQAKLGLLRQKLMEQ